MGQGWSSQARGGGVRGKGGLRHGAAESLAPAQVEHRGGLRRVAAGANGRWRDGSDAAGVWPGAAETGSTRLAGNGPATVAGGEP